MTYPTFQDQNGVRYKYNGVLNQVDGGRLVFYTKMDDYACKIVFRDNAGELTPFNVCEEVNKAMEAGDVYKR